MTSPRRDLSEVLLSLDACNDAPDDAVPWARPYGAEWERALAEWPKFRCPDFFWLAQKLLFRCERDFDARLACAAARSVLHFVPDGEDRPRLAIETTERWMRGEATEQEVRNAVYDATEAVSVYRDRAEVFYAARAARDCALLSEAKDDDARDAHASDAIDAASEAAEFVSYQAILNIVKRELGPVLLKALDAYAANLPAA